MPHGFAALLKLLEGLSFMCIAWWLQAGHNRIDGVPVACQVANDAKMLYATFNPMPCPNSTVHDAMLDKAKAGVLLADTRAEHRSLLVRSSCRVAHA